MFDKLKRALAGGAAASVPPRAPLRRQAMRDVTVDEVRAIAAPTVPLIPKAEHALVRRDGGLGELLDLFDANDHPMVFDPQRISYV